MKTSFQPFVEFEERFMVGLAKTKAFFVVFQTYKRGLSLFTQQVMPLMLTAYDDRGLAEIHFKNVRHDVNSRLLSMKEEMECKEILRMVQNNEQYKIFWSKVDNGERLAAMIRQHYPEKIIKFIEKKTNWRIGKSDELHASYHVIFGELQVSFRWKTQRMEGVKFEEIENS